MDDRGWHLSTDAAETLAERMRDFGFRTGGFVLRTYTSAEFGMDQGFDTFVSGGDAAGTLNIRHPRQAADLFLSMFLGDGHIRGLLMLDMPDARENRALLREAVRVFIAAYAKAP